MPNIYGQDPSSLVHLQFNKLQLLFNKTFTEVGSKNMVTGIYLDYRLFDSLLEAGILFVVTAGILFMGKKDEEVR